MNQTCLEVISWEEPPIEDFSVANAVNIAHVEYRATGYLEGTIRSVYVIHYSNYDLINPAKAQSVFTGYSIFVGKVGNRYGNITFFEKGKHDNGLDSQLTIERISGELSEIDGVASYSIVKGKVILQTSF